MIQMNLSILLATGFLAALSLAQTPDAATQDQWSALRILTADTTVRVQTAASRPIEGRLARVTDDAIVIRTKRGEQTWLRTSVISVSVKGKSHRARHTLIGFAIGAGIGLSAGEVYDLSNPCTKLEFCILTAPVGKVVLGPAGALIGTAIGAAIPGSSWQVVYKR
jgi:hypothetical protein